MRFTSRESEPGRNFDRPTLTDSKKSQRIYQIKKTKITQGDCLHPSYRFCSRLQVPSVHVKKLRARAVKQLFHFLVLKQWVSKDIARDLPYPKIEKSPELGHGVMHTLGHFHKFFAASGQGAVYTFLPIFALQLKMTSSQVGVILAANIFIIAFLQRVCGTLADRVNPKYLVILGTFASGMTVFGMPFVEGFVMILLLNILMGMANGFALPGGLVIIGKLGRTMGMASLMTITDAAWSLGMIVSPILSGIILDVFGLSYVFIIGSLLILTGSAVVTLFLRDYQPEQVF